MKKILAILTATILLSAISQAAVIMTFDTRHAQGTDTAIGDTSLAAGTNPSGVLDANLEASSLTFGAGTGGSNTSNQRFVTAGFNNTTVAGALAAGEYLTFTVDAVAGYQVNLSTVLLQLHGQSGQDFDWGLYSSADGFASQLAGETGLAGSPAGYTRTVNVSSIGVQTGAIEFRIAFGAVNEWVYVGVGDTDPSGTWPDYGQAIQVDGLVEIDPGYVPQIPATPSNLAATATSPIAIDLSWDDASDNETGFYIERGPDAGSFSVIATNDANTTSFSDSGLSDNTEYFYRVSAFNATGSSINNPVDSATTPVVNTVPEAPTDLVATAVSSNSVNLGWADNSLYETGFAIERKSGGAFAPLTTVAAGIVSFSDTGLAADTQYTYQVKAFNTVGDSSYTAEASATTFSTNSGVIMTFDTRDDSGTTSTVVGQTALAAGESPNSGVLNANLETSALTFGAGTTGSNLAEQKYIVQGFADGSTAFTAAESLAAGNYLTFTVDAAPGYQVSVDSIRFEFSFQNNNAGFEWGIYSSVDGFAAQLDGETGIVGASDGHVATATIGIADQIGSIEFRIAIGAVNEWVSAGVADNGDGGWPDYSQAVQVNGLVETDPGYVPQIPATPGNLAATVVSPTAIDLSWDDASDDELGFYIERGPNTSSFSVIATNAANTTSFSDSGLSFDTEYFYRVSAFNAAGSSINNPVASATTPALTAPEAPTDLVAAAVGSTSINLGWSDNSLYEAGFAIERKSGGAFAPLTTVAAGVVSFSDTGLAADTEYTYQVKAFNTVGDSSYTDEASATTFSASTTTLIYEPFVYGGNSGDNLSSTVPAYTDSDGDGIGALLRPGLAFAGSLSSGFAAATTAQEMDYRSDVSLNFVTEGTLYLSGLFQADTDDATWGGGALTAFSLSFSSHVDQESLWIGLCNSDENGVVSPIRPYAGFGIWQDTPGSNDYVVGTGDLTAATTYFVLAKVVATGGNQADISLLVVEDGGTIPTVEPTTWDATITGATYEYPLTSGNLDRLGVRQAHSPADIEGLSNLSDEFRVATSYAGALPSDGGFYSYWEALYGLVEGPEGDDDNDNMSNFYEYALNGNPTNPADTGMIEYGGDGAGFFAYIYGKRLDDTSLVYTLEDTTDLILGPVNTDAWDSRTSGPSGVAGFDSVTNKYDMTGEPQQFIKLIIE
ncbi:MAG: hypothetical protein DRP64_00865 [Verrucomicrobia bacterium]|nr:MAG: hypothetical protein DRP64_00865 [Verrucomicrobiota bacterium]